uniref:PiggyBac transposable element-derived protein domain-containing protein n=1 Tax=Glossina austeni TaxID=7395 RepID=A0A1A9UGF5_GLOAU
MTSQKSGDLFDLTTKMNEANSYKTITKPNKKVLILSSTHSPVEIEKNDTRIPETIRFYNSNSV